MTAAISDSARYIVSVVRVDPGGSSWAYPPLSVTARSVRGALTAALVEPLSTWHELDDDEPDTERGQP